MIFSYCAGDSSVYPLTFEIQKSLSRLRENNDNLDNYFPHFLKKKLDIYLATLSFFFLKCKTNSENSFPFSPLLTLTDPELAVFISD